MGTVAGEANRKYWRCQVSAAKTIDVTDFKTRQIVNALADAIHFAVLDYWKVSLPCERSRDMANAVLLTLQPDQVPAPSATKPDLPDDPHGRIIVWKGVTS